MDKKELKEDVFRISFDIIMKAGDARNNLQDALEYAKENDFEKADQQLKSAKENITAAHQSQTHILQMESSGEAVEFQVIFTHAQDTLMTINSEYIMSKKLIEIFKEIDARLQKIEKGTFTNQKEDIIHEG